jgi:hypothetical protein
MFVSPISLSLRDWNAFDHQNLIEGFSATPRSVFPLDTIGTEDTVRWMLIVRRLPPYYVIAT